MFSGEKEVSADFCFPEGMLFIYLIAVELSCPSNVIFKSNLPIISIRGSVPNKPKGERVHALTYNFGHFFFFLNPEENDYTLQGFRKSTSKSINKCAVRIHIQLYCIILKNKVLFLGSDLLGGGCSEASESVFVRNENQLVLP